MPNVVPSDIKEELTTIQERLDDEAAITAKYGSGLWGYFRGALHEFSKKGMRNRVLLVFCAFALQNLSGAAGMTLAFIAGPRRLTMTQQSTITRLHFSDRSELQMSHCILEFTGW